MLPQILCESSGLATSKLSLGISDNYKKKLVNFSQECPYSWSRLWLTPSLSCCKGLRVSASPNCWSNFIQGTVSKRVSKILQNRDVERLTRPIFPASETFLRDTQYLAKGFVGGCFLISQGNLGFPGSALLVAAVTAW